MKNTHTILKIIIILIFPLMVLGQEFQISSGSAVMPFTVDPFTKVIYYRNFFNYKTMSVNIDGSNELETFFPTVP